jgi:hypothetical protein
LASGAAAAVAAAAVGDVPLVWYKDEDHIGYDIEVGGVFWVGLRGALLLEAVSRMCKGTPLRLISAWISLSKQQLLGTTTATAVAACQALHIIQVQCAARQAKHPHKSQRLVGLWLRVTGRQKVGNLLNIKGPISPPSAEASAAAAAAAAGTPALAALALPVCKQMHDRDASICWAHLAVPNHSQQILASLLLLPWLMLMTVCVKMHTDCSS